jgi:regulator of replication initiation timing
MKFTSQESLVESLEVYEKAFAEIKRVTGTDDVEGLVQQFKAVEDTNFSLFNFVNEINNEIEKLSEEISDAQVKIDELKVEGVDMDEERKQDMVVLESTLSAALAKNQQYEKQSSDSSYGISEIRKGVDKLVKVFQSTRFSFADGQAHIGEQPQSDAIDEQSTPVAVDGGEEEPQNESNFTNFALGSSTAAITDNNLLQLLGVIENKMNELMTLNYMFISPRKITSAGSSAQPNVEDSTAEKLDAPASREREVLVMPLLGTVGGLLGLGPVGPVGNISIVTPSTGDDRDSDDNLSDEEDRPLTREELRQKTLKGVCV